MYAKKHRPMQKLTAICLSVSIAAASLLSGHVFAFDESAQPDGELLYGQELLNELREMGLGQPDEDIVTDPVPETPAPGTDAETGGESASDPEQGDTTNPGDSGAEDGSTGETTPPAEGETPSDTEEGDTTDPDSGMDDGSAGETTPPAEGETPSDTEEDDTTDPDLGAEDGSVGETTPPAEDETPSDTEEDDTTVPDSGAEDKPATEGRVPLLIDNDEVTVEEPTTVEDEDKTPAEPSGSDDGETPPTGNTSDEETTSGEDGSTNPPESQNPSEPSSEPSTPATPGEGENEGSNSSEPQEPSVPSTPSTPGEGETTPPTGGDGGNTGEQPIGPSHPIETPSESTGSEDIPEEDPPAAGYDRAALEAYVQELDAEQIVSLDETDITEAEANDLLSMLTEEQLAAIDELLAPPTYGVNFTNPAPLVESEDLPVFRPLRANALTSGGADNPYLETDKTATIDENGEVTITLDAYTTGTVTTSQEGKPVDVVLVLDVSGSMDEAFSYTEGHYEYTKVFGTDDTYGEAADYAGDLFVKQNDGTYDEVEIESEGHDWVWDGLFQGHYTYYTYTLQYPGEWWDDPTPIGSVDVREDEKLPVELYTRHWVGETSTSKMDALKDAVSGFIDSMEEQNADISDEALKNRLAIVQFADDSEEGNNRYGYNGSKIIANMQVVDSDNSAYLQGVVNAIDAGGATAADWGMNCAKEAFGTPSQPTDDRQRVVIMFTDGEPNHGNGFNTQVANTTIDYAHDLKHDYGATVYTIGVFSGADPTDTDSNFNRYMHGVSSNYPDAMGIYNLGDRAPDTQGEEGYYLSANDSEHLNKIFQNLSEIVTGGTQSTLNSEAVVRDVITEYFEVPEESDVQAWKVPCKSYDEDTKVPTFDEERSNWTPVNDITIDENDRTIDVSGFAFNEHYLRETEYEGSHGYKLHIEITTAAREGFLGGNGVPTNDGESGVYTNDKGDCVENFDIPEVDVPINTPTVDALDKNVYLLGDLTEAQMTEGATVTVYDVTSEKNPYHLDLGVVNFGLQPWQNRFVNISVTTTPESEMTNLTEDKLNEFGITVTVSPKTIPGTATEQTDSATANVYVFKPEITWKDSAINAGETPNYDDSTQDNCNFVGVQWKHGDTVANPGIMVNTEPELEYTFTPPEGALTEETLVNVTVSIGEQNIDQYVTHHHEDCTFEGCQWQEGQCEFIVHIKSFNLTVKKTVTGGDSGNDSFRFTVTGPDGFETSFTLEAGEEIVLKDLPSGTYTVEEDQSWSWRYEVQGSATQTVGPDGIENGEAIVLFTNKKTDNHWLSWEDTEVNLFGNVS